MNDNVSIRGRAARGWWPVLALAMLAVEVSPASGQIFTSWPIERGKRFPGCYVEFGLPPRGGPDACWAYPSFNAWPVRLPMEMCQGLKPGESTGMATGGRIERGGWIPLRRVIYPEGHPVCERMTGEPHAVTFDGVRYDLQAAGEFVGVRSMDDDLEVQYRLEGRGRPPRVSATSAVAARVGGRRVVLTAGRDPRLRVDGEPVELPEGRLMYLTEQEDAALVREYERYTIIWPDRSNLHVDVHSSYLNTYFLAPPGRDGRLVGLFGDGDGNSENDFRTRDDRLLPSPPPFSALYGEFAESWRVRPGESLFDYGPGESTDTFTDRSVPAGPATVDDLSPADRARAEAACRNAGVTEPEPFEECVFDVGHTGDEAFIASALDQQTPPAFAREAARFLPEPIVSGLCRPAPAATAATSSRADASRTGRFATGLSGFRGEPRWSAGGFRSGHAPLAVDGRVIAARERGIVALDGATGRQVWEAGEPGGRIAGRGLVAAGGAVFAAQENTLAAYDLDAGAECWRLPIGPGTGPVYATGRLYLSVAEGDTGYVTAVDASSGRIVWRTEARNRAPANWPNPSAPAVGGDAVFLADGPEIVALDRESGRVRWRTATGTGVTEGLAYDGEVVYAPDRSGGLHALDAATGAVLWVFSEPGVSVHNAVALSDRLVYLADERHLHAIERASGAEAWKIEAQRTSRFNAPVVAGERLYAVTHEGELVVLDAETGAEIHRTQVSGPRTYGESVPTPGPGGLFFVLPDGTLNAYR